MSAVKIVEYTSPSRASEVLGPATHFTVCAWSNDDFIPGGRINRVKKSVRLKWYKNRWWTLNLSARERNRKSLVMRILVSGF